MKHFFFRLIVLCFVFGSGIEYPAFAQSDNPIDHVNPFLGTDFFGHTFPGASRPFAMVHLSPDINTQGWTYCAGSVSYTHLRAHETDSYLVCRLLLEKKKKKVVKKK